MNDRVSDEDEFGGALKATATPGVRLLKEKRPDYSGRFLFQTEREG
jgi:hypothetical protein